MRGSLLNPRAKREGSLDESVPCPDYVCPPLSGLHRLASRKRTAESGLQRTLIGRSGRWGVRLEHQSQAVFRFTLIGPGWHGSLVLRINITSTNGISQGVGSPPWP